MKCYRPPRGLPRRRNHRPSLPRCPRQLISTRAASGLLLLFLLTIVSAPISSQQFGDGERSYSGIITTFQIDWNSVSELEPPYSELTYSAGGGTDLRKYSAEGWGIASDVAYLHPLARTVHVDEIRATTRRSDHEVWAGGRIYLAASRRMPLSWNASGESSLSLHLDAGMLVSFYSRSADNIFEERSFDSTRIGASLAAKPGLILETDSALFFGINALIGVSVINRETVRRRYQNDLRYNAFFNGMVFAPGFTVGVAH